MPSPNWTSSSRSPKVGAITGFTYGVKLTLEFSNSSWRPQTYPDGRMKASLPTTKERPEAASE